MSGFLKPQAMINWRFGTIEESPLHDASNFDSPMCTRSMAPAQPSLNHAMSLEIPNKYALV